MSEPAWGHHCGDGWRAAVREAGGPDICDTVGPSPRSAREWSAMMRRLGVRSLSGVVSAVHGQPLSSPRLARRGDIVRRGWALGVCRGEAAEFYGGVMVPMAQAEEAWRVSVKGLEAHLTASGDAVNGASFSQSRPVFMVGHHT